MSTKVVKKTLEQAQGVPNAEIDFSDKSLVHMDDMTRLWTMRNITRLTLSHNKISELPPAIAICNNRSDIDIEDFLTLPIFKHFDGGYRPILDR